MSQAPAYTTHSAHSAGRHYQEMGIRTAGKFELVLILYRGAAHQIKMAKNHFAQGKLEARVLSINKAISMIDELRSTLDLENGKDIAASLDRLYDYMTWRLSQANIEKDEKALDDVLKVLQILQSAWEEASAKLSAAPQERETLSENV